MIKIFDANDTDFSSAGNIIIESAKCREFKKKSLNGWYIEVEIPIKYREFIKKDKLCVVKTKSKLNPQAFRIAENIKITNRKISFTAEHVMFDARNLFLVDVRPTNLNGINTLNYINQRTDVVSPFKVFSNVENINTAYFIRKNLLEAWEIIEERWNGIFDADNWDISFLQKVGNDNGENIIYGKNMQSLEIYEDWTNVVTKLYPIGYDGLMLPETFIESDIKYEVPYTKKLDFQTDLEEEDRTEENLIQELREKAKKYIEINKYPQVNYTTTSNINDNMEIGDTIQVLHPLVSIKTEVLEYEYDINSKKIKSLTFGNYSRDVKTKFDSIKQTITQLRDNVSNQEAVVKKQTEMINSLNKNGYVYIDDNEILILDKIPKESAKHVWRFGMAGLGYSSNGYEGPFETAITMDGQINAKFITTGTMSVNRIEGLANKITEYDENMAEITLNLNSITQTVSETKKEAAKTQTDVENLRKETIISVDVEYVLGTSTEEAPTENWSTKAPTWENGKYMWQRTVTTYADKTQEISDATCISGAKGQDGIDGVGIEETTIEYQASNSGTETPTGEWLKTIPNVPAGEYLWTRTKLLYTDKQETISYSVARAGINGVTLYTWLKYADTPTSGMSDSPEGKTYMGLAYNKTTQVESTKYSDYTWSLIKGKDGIPGAPGEKGQTTYTWVKYATSNTGANMSDSPEGKTYIGLAYNKTTAIESNNAEDYTWALIKGEDGVGVEKTEVSYQTSNSGTTIPTNTWQDTIPAVEEGQYFWTRTIITYTDKSSSTSYSISKMGQNGTNGDNGIGVKEIEEEYYLSTSDKDQVNGSWKNTQDTWTIGKYIWTRSKITWTDGNITYTTPTLATGLNKANETAQNAKTTADNVDENLTANYSTTVQMETAIEQTSKNILETVSGTYTTITNLEAVEKRLQASLELKLNIDDLISEINASADRITLDAGRLVITAGNFKLDANGNITATGGTIGGFTLDTTTFTGSLNGVYNYNNYDLRGCMSTCLDIIIPDANLRDLYDYNSDNKINSADFSYIQRVITGKDKNTKQITGTLEINSKDPKNCISIERNGQICASLGVGGVNANLVTTESIICGYIPGSEFSDYTAVVVDGNNAKMSFVKQGNVTTTISPELIKVPRIAGYLNLSKNVDCLISTDESDPTIANIDLVNQYASDRFLKITDKIGKAYGVNLWESDRNLKKNIKESNENALEIIKKIKHREFVWKDSNKKQKIGYVAQEMEQINEDFVIKVPQQDKKIIYQINENSIIPYLTKAVQELELRIRELEGVN